MGPLLNLLWFSNGLTRSKLVEFNGVCTMQNPKYI